MIKSLFLRMLSVMAIFIFTIILFAGVSHAVDTNIKVGKYRVGVNYSPFSACAVWLDAGNYLGRAVDTAEYLALSKEVFGLSVLDAIARIEAIEVTRLLTGQEEALCLEMVALDQQN